MTLKLTLHKMAFDVMITGEKKLEFRTPGKWLYSRLFDQKTGKPKPIKYVEFTNGYGAHMPKFTCEFKGIIEGYSINKTYSNGFTVECDNITAIKLGRIISKENI